MRYISPIALVLALCISAVAQVVTIESKEEVYTRPKPIQDFKKQFTVTRPIAKTTDRARAKKITEAISPEAMLDFDLEREMGEVQWVEETGYDVLYNGRGVLAIRLWMYGSAAYPDDVSRTTVIDLSTGSPAFPEKVFTDLEGLAKLIKAEQKREIAAAIEEMKADPDNSDLDPDELFGRYDFSAENIIEYSVDDDGVTFYYDYAFPHVAKALEPQGKYTFTWAEIKPFIRRDGLLARFLSYYTYPFMSERKIRVLVAKPGLDGHDRGAKVIARALRDAGMEVIYTGLRQTPEMIAAAALQEDVDAVGISILSGAHKTLCPRIVDLLHENGMDDTLVLVGGIVPNEDIPALKEKGVSEVFLPGTSTEDIVKYINANVRNG